MIAIVDETKEIPYTVLRMQGATSFVFTFKESVKQNYAREQQLCGQTIINLCVDKQLNSPIEIESAKFVIYECNCPDELVIKTGEPNQEASEIIFTPNADDEEKFDSLTVQLNECLSYENCFALFVTVQSQESLYARGLIYTKPAIPTESYECE